VIIQGILTTGLIKKEEKHGSQYKTVVILYNNTEKKNKPRKIFNKYF
jgi:hypothetical protein